MKYGAKVTVKQDAAGGGGEVNLTPLWWLLGALGRRRTYVSRADSAEGSLAGWGQELSLL